MATTTFQSYTGDGSNKDFNFSFPSFTASEVVVEVDGVVVDNFHIVNYSTSSSGTKTVRFDNGDGQGSNSSGTINNSVCNSTTGAPLNLKEVIVRRDTDVDSAKATFTAGSSLKAADLTNSVTQILRALQEEQNTPTTTPRIRNAAVTTAKIKADNITSALIADDQIDSEHIVADSIDTEHYAPSSVDTTALGTNAVTAAKLAANAVFTHNISDGEVTREKIHADAIDSTKLADNAVNSEHYVDGSIDSVHLSNSAIGSNQIANNAVTTTEILNGAVTTNKLGADAVDGTKLADNAVDSEHYVDGSIDRVHLEADIIDSTKLADNSVNSEHYVDGSIGAAAIAEDAVGSAELADDAVANSRIQNNAVNTVKIADDAVTIDKIADSVIVTNSEQAASTPNDTSFFTTAAAEARYFNASTGETIKDGQSFPDNDTSIATTAAINDRIIDLIDDVGGFVPIANETSFPNANPDVNNGTGTIVSVSTLASSHTSNGSGTFTISNGTVGNSTVTITGAANNTTYSAGYGLLVETTTTLNTYTFHRLVPKATEVTAVAGKATEIGRLGTADAVADMAILGTADVVADLNTLGTADVVADLNTLGTADVVADMNTLAVTSVVNNMDTVATNVANVNNVGGSISNVNTTAGSIANVNTVAGSISNVNSVAGSISNVNTTAGSISNVNTVANNIASVNSFANVYRTGTQNPQTSLDVGDLFFNQTSNSLKVYTGSAWVDGVTATGNFAVLTGNTFTGSNVHNDNVKSLYGTGSDLEIFHDNNGDSNIINNTGHLTIRNNTAGKIINLQPKAAENGVIVRYDGAAELYYDNSKKLETTSYGTKVTDFLNVGKTDAPSKALELYQASNAALRIQNSSTGVGSSDGFLLEQSGLNSLLVNYEAGNIDLKTANTTRLLIKSDGHLEIPVDDKALKVGASQDLQIYHGSGASIIQNSTGPLRLQGNDVQLANFNNSDTYFRGQADNAAELYFDNSKKLATKSNGIDVTGDVDATGHIEVISDSKKFMAGASNDVRMYHDGTDSYFDSVTGNLYLYNHLNGKSIIFGTQGANRWKIMDSGHYIPNADSTFDIGTSTVRVRNIYADTLYGDGSNLTGINTDLVADTSPQLGGDLDTNSHHILIDDGHAVKWGNDTDLEIQHTGGYAHTHNSTGNYIIDSTGCFYVRDTSGSTNSLIACPASSIELYYNGSKKFETYANGTKLYGNLIGLDAGKYVQWQGSSSTAFAIGMTSGADSPTGSDQHLQFHHWNNTSWDKVFYVHRDYINIPDNKKIGFGDSNDLLIYHDGSDSYISETGTGALIIDAPNTIWRDGKKVVLGTDSDLQIYHNGTHAYFTNLTGNAFIEIPESKKFQVQHGTEAILNGYADDRVELYYDNNKKFYTTSTGVSLGAVTHTLKWPAFANTSASRSWGFIGEDGTYGKFELKYSNGNDETLDEVATRFYANGEVWLLYDNSLKFRTLSTGSEIYSGDLRFPNQGNWPGNYGGSIKHHSNFLYVQGGSNGIRFRDNGSNDRWIIDSAGDLTPGANNSYDIGHPSYRVANIYTNDLHLSNQGHSNDVDGTWGDWTIQEGESDLFLKNNRSGKKYKFNLTEVA